ncbi:DUF4913 domain-containing protein [Streptomyces sp. NRRL WC-3742]|uniref:DUF4913 domain-containing protein n=1 Tax=Streptomyces sp. NRRL WC-3742 TaxID=1463934 RepID=UPI0006908CBF|nr:DUF4913 domain-containing protein [Streptomyces sp. NRRL WC-3742]
MSTDTTPPLAAVAEDLEDAKAKLNELDGTITDFATQLESNTRQLGELGDAVADLDARLAESGDGAGKKKEAPSAPPFIMRLAGDAYLGELGALRFWVNEFLVPTYLSEVSSSAPWCASWQLHPAAVARLHACWLAWQELTDPKVCGLTGPSVWHRDHLDPMIAQLRSPAGPFVACMTMPDRPQHMLIDAPLVH